MFDNFTDSTKELIFQAQNMAIENHNTLIEPAHILSSMSSSTIESVNMLFSQLKLNNHLFVQDIKNIVNNLPKTSEINDKIYFSKNCLALFEKANEKAKFLKDKFVSPEHILLAIANVDDADIKRIVNKYQLDEDKILNAMKDIRGDKKVDSKNADEDFKILEKFS